jgi:hypothetical protein
MRRYRELGRLLTFLNGSKLDPCLRKLPAVMVLMLAFGGVTDAQKPPSPRLRLRQLRVWVAMQIPGLRYPESKVEGHCGREPIQRGCKPVED